MHIFDRVSRIKTMRFECDPSIIGKFYVAFAVFTAVLFPAIALLTGEETHTIDIIILTVLTVPALLLGLYFWFVRRKMARHEIDIGTWSDDLYNRSRPLYVLYECVSSTLYLGLILAILYLIESHTGTAEENADMEIWRTWVVFFLWVDLFNIANNVINRNAYYHHSINAYEYNGLNESFSWRTLWDGVKREWHF